MASQTIPYITPEQYLEAELKAEYRSEYVDGQIYAMAGASRRHVGLVINLTRELSLALMERPCEMFITELRLQVSATRYLYPDVMIVCGEPKFAEADLDTLVNPEVIIEVLSPSTEAYDRGAKFGFYRSLPSLKEYLLISQASQTIEHYTRGADGVWNFEAIEGPGTRITLSSLKIELALDRIYLKVKLVGE